MLLRSSSTPILGSLLPPFAAHDTVPEDPEHPPSILDGARSLPMRRFGSHCSMVALHASSLPSSSESGPQLFPVIDEDIATTNAGIEEQDANALLSSKLRRVQSENDVSKASSMNSASMVAASSLLDEGAQKKGPWPKPGNVGGSLRRKGRQRSLSSISSLYSCLGAQGLDREDCIPEEAETSSGVRVFETLGSHFGGKPGPFPQSKSSLVLEVKDGEVSVRERAPQTGSAACSARQSGGFYGAGGSHPASTGMGCGNNTLKRADRAAVKAEEGLCGGGVEGGNMGGGRPPVALLGGRGGGGNGGGGYPNDSLDLHFQTMLEKNPGHPLFLRNYAQYLAETKRDVVKAEEYYQRAILANPADGELLAQFATILWDVHRDHERATSYFDRAVQAAPDDSYVMAAHASFLWSSEEEEEISGPTPAFPPFPYLVSAGQA